MLDCFYYRNVKQSHTRHRKKKLILTFEDSEKLIEYFSRLQALGVFFCDSLDLCYDPCHVIQGLLNRWMSQLDLGCTTGGLERVVSVHNST